MTLCHRRPILANHTWRELTTELVSDGNFICHRENTRDTVLESYEERNVDTRTPLVQERTGTMTGVSCQRGSNEHPFHAARVDDRTARLMVSEPCRPNVGPRSPSPFAWCRCNNRCCRNMPIICHLEENGSDAQQDGHRSQNGIEGQQAGEFLQKVASFTNLPCLPHQAHGQSAHRSIGFACRRLLLCCAHMSPHRATQTSP